MIPLNIRKTYKLYVGGKFIRSESGHTYQTEDRIDNFPQSTRKDLRNAVQAARAAFTGWASATAYNRGQVLYRGAEMLDGRRDEFVALLGTAGAEAEVDDSVSSLIWYAGWCDKLGAVAGTINPVAGPYFCFTFPEPTGIVGIICPRERPLLTLVRACAAAVCSGNTAIAILPETAPQIGLLWAEVLAVSDLPSGVINLLSGYHYELLPTLASHLDINAIEASGCTSDELRTVQGTAAGSVKRVVADGSELSLKGILNLMELKTVWHPTGV